MDLSTTAKNILADIQELEGSPIRGKGAIITEALIRYLHYLEHPTAKPPVSVDWMNKPGWLALLVNGGLYKNYAASTGAANQPKPVRAELGFPKSPDMDKSPEPVAAEMAELDSEIQTLKDQIQSLWASVPGDMWGHRDDQIIPGSREQQVTKPDGSVVTRQTQGTPAPGSIFESVAGEVIPLNAELKRLTAKRKTLADSLTAEDKQRLESRAVETKLAVYDPAPDEGAPEGSLESLAVDGRYDLSSQEFWAGYVALSMDEQDRLQVAGWEVSQVHPLGQGIFRTLRLEQNILD